MFLYVWWSFQIDGEYVNDYGIKWAGFELPESKYSNSSGVQYSIPHDMIPYIITSTMSIVCHQQDAWIDFINHLVKQFTIHTFFYLLNYTIL
jgi:hypothetical protein